MGVTKTVVCFGDSITRGQVSANYVSMLASSPHLQDFRFINRGVNSDLTLNLLRRVNRVVADQPDVVTILVGTNDLIATVRPYSAAYFTFLKSMYYMPNRGTSRRNLTQTIRRLKMHTHARIALCSIPILGEALESRPMDMVRFYNAAWREIAAQEKVDFLPVFERQSAWLLQNNGRNGRQYNGSAFYTAEYILRALFTGETLDQFSQRKGYRLLTDSVHMNTTGARLIFEVIEEYLLRIVRDESHKPGL